MPNLILNQRWNLLPEGYDDLCEKLRIYRSARMELKCDKKILTAWNGLMLMALSKAARVFSDRRYLMAAQALADFMGEKLLENGNLKARLCDGELKFDAQLDDYAFYALGLLELYAADFEPEHIVRAKELAAHIISDFADGNGGYYRTAEYSEKLLFRPREIFDSAMPSGNSAAATVFDLLFRYTGDILMRQHRDELLSLICAHCGKYPAGCPWALCAVLSDVYPTRELLCVSPDEAVPELLSAVTSRYSPELTVILKSPRREKELAAIVPFSRDALCKDGKAAFYICENGACREGLSL